MQRLAPLAAFVVALAAAAAGCPAPPPEVVKKEPPPEPTETATPDAGPPAPPPRPPAGTRMDIGTHSGDESWSTMLAAGGRVYWITEIHTFHGGKMYVPEASILWSAPRAGGEATRHFGLKGLGQLAADDKFLYVATNRDLSTIDTPQASAITGTIERMPLGGGARATLAKEVAPRVIAVDGDFVYADVGKGGLARMPKDGSGAPQPFLAEKNVMAVAFDADFVYASVVGGRVVRVPKKGGATQTIMDKLPQEPSGLAVDDAFVYAVAVSWSSKDIEHGVVARAPKAGGPLEILAKDRPAAHFGFLEHDRLYWAEGKRGFPGQIFRLAGVKSGGAAGPEVVAEDTTLEQMTADDDSIYFASDGKFKGSGSTIERLAPPVIVRVVE